MILAITLIFLAAVFNAVMDKTKDNIQYRSSVFYQLDIRFWSDEAWGGNYLPFTAYKLNAWHLSKSLMLSCLFAIPFVYEPLFWYFDYLIMGAVWISVFNLFYNKILKK